MKVFLRVIALLAAVVILVVIAGIVSSRQYTRAGDTAATQATSIVSSTVTSSTNSPLVTIKPTRVAQGHWAEYAQTLPMTSDVQSAEDLPVYPGAQQVTTEHQPFPLGDLIEFKTADTVEAIAMFYVAVLPRKGWRLLPEVEFRGAEKSDPYTRLNFLWSDPKEVTPYRLWLAIGVGVPPTADGKPIAGPVSVSVGIDKERWPSSARVPTYADAKQINVTDHAGQYGFTERITTYVTSARPEELEEYYKRTLPQYGWTLGGYGPNEEDRRLIGTGPITEGLIFIYESGGPEDSRSGGVTIVPTTVGSGLTDVEIRSDGNDLPEHP